MTVYVRKFKSQGETVVAVCDCGLLGKCFHEGKLILEVKREFYEGSLASVEDALKVIEASTIANIVGEGIVSKAIKAGLVCEESVIRISGVPHAQMIVL
jgi:hypothetical protein